MPNDDRKRWPLLIGSYVAILGVLAIIGFLVVTA